MGNAQSYAAYTTNACAPVGPPATTCTAALATPSPSLVQCGTYGQLNSPSNSGNALHVSNFKACRDNCLNAGVPKCVSFSYTPKSRECQMYNQPLRKQGYTNVNQHEGKVFYSHECFSKQCQELCHTVLLGNLSTRDWEVTGQYWAVSLPFPMELYGQEFREIFVSTNGYLTTKHISAQNPHADPPGPLPQYENNPSALFPYWEKQTFANDSDAMWYTVRGIAPHRQITFYWKVGQSIGASPTSYISGNEFHVSWKEEEPGVFTFAYDALLDNGDNALIGMQSDGEKAEYLQYGYSHTVVAPSKTMVFDSNANTVSPTPLDDPGFVTGNLL